MKWADRMKTIPPYLFLELDRIIECQRSQGIDMINFGIGDPDQPTPVQVVNALKKAAEEVSNHRYPNYLGSLPFRQAISRYYQQRFGVSLDPTEEVVALIGSKEGIAHLIWAAAGPGDVVLVPDPAYPVYYTQTLLAGATPYTMPLTAENQFLPDLDRIPEDVLKKATMLWVNYPNNPTGAVATRDFFKKAVDLCRRHDILLCSDAAYVEIGFDGYKPPSILEIEGAKDVAIEFYSLSKPFNMTGWRIAAAVGNQDAVKALGTIKSNLDSGPFTAVQEAAIKALESDPGTFFNHMNQIYRERRDLTATALRSMGLEFQSPLSTFYLWFRTPEGMSSSEATQFFVEHAHVVVAPGEAYGQSGQGWLRISLTIDSERLKEGLDRMKNALKTR